MRTKILFIITKSNFGGAQRYVYDLARALPNDTYDVAVAFGYAPEGRAGMLSRLLIEAGIRTIVVPELTRNMHPLRDFSALTTLIGLLNYERPDIVHLNSSKAGGIGSLACRIVGIPNIIFTAHGLPFDEARSRVSRFALKVATWLTITLSHHTIVVSKDSLDRARALPFLYSKISLIYNGIETPDFHNPSEAKKALRSIDPTIGDTPLIGTIAELHPNKDLETAIEGIRITDAHLVIIGEGELREKLEAYAAQHTLKNRVHFLGYIPEAAKYIRAFDVFLFTSIKEGLPYALLEAGAAHVPIVAVDIPGVRDIVLPEYTGILTVREAPAIASALQRVLKDSALRESLVQQMAKRVHDTFSISHMREKTFALYEAPQGRN